MSETKMGRKKLQMEEKSRALTLLEKGESVIAAARDIGRGLKRGNLSFEEVCRVIITWDGTKTEVWLWRTKEDFSKNR